MRDLKKDSRDILVMKYVDDLSTQEIAKITDKSENAIYITISRGLKELKEIVNKNERQ